MAKESSNIRKHIAKIETIAIMVFSVSLGLVFKDFGAIGDLDSVFYDSYHIIYGTRYDAAKSVIVEIDDPTLDILKDLPLVCWGPKFALTIGKLKEIGVGPIVLDFLLLSSPRKMFKEMKLHETTREVDEYDSPFYAEIAKGGIVLASKVSSVGDAKHIILPSAEYRSFLTDSNSLGIANFINDQDNTVRYYTKKIKINKSSEINKHTTSHSCMDHHNTLAMSAYTKVVGVEDCLEPDKLELISWSGPPGTIKRISMSRFLSRDNLTVVEIEKLKGKAVFIGSSAGVFGDKQQTPYSRNLPWIRHRDMDSIEIHANIFETIAGIKPLKVVPLYISLLFWSIVLSVAVYAEKQNEHTYKILLEITTIGAMTIIGFIIFANGYYIPHAGITSTAAIFIFASKTYYFTKNKIVFK